MSHMSGRHRMIYRSVVVLPCLAISDLLTHYTRPKKGPPSAGSFHIAPSARYSPSNTRAANYRAARVPRGSSGRSIRVVRCLDLNFQLLTSLLGRLRAGGGPLSPDRSSVMIRDEGRRPGALARGLGGESELRGSFSSKRPYPSDLLFTVLQITTKSAVCTSHPTTISTPNCSPTSLLTGPRGIPMNPVRPCSHAPHGPSLSSRRSVRQRCFSLAAKATKPLGLPMTAEWRQYSF